MPSPHDCWGQFLSSFWLTDPLSIKCNVEIDLTIMWTMDSLRSTFATANIDSLITLFYFNSLFFQSLNVIVTLLLTKFSRNANWFAWVFLSTFLKWFLKFNKKFNYPSLRYRLRKQIKFVWQVTELSCISNLLFFYIC